MTPLFDLSGKVAIVTGSSRGIGKAAAEQLAAHGAKVVISSRKQTACDDVAAEINARHGPGTASACAASISDPAALQALVAHTLASFGRIDILVCNAASNPFYGTMSEIADEVFRKVLDNNILSIHRLIQLALPDMRQRRDGSVIIISSVAGQRPWPNIGAYGISKAADIQLARTYAMEHGRDNVRFNCIAPGLIRTEFARALWEDPETERKNGETAALNRMGLPDEIAGAVVYLAAPASAFMTGQTLVIDGGMV